MSSLLGGIRGTVQGVIGATDHVLWWVSWHTHGIDGVRSGVRTAPERQGA